jgi:cell division protein FtsI (penicillin-binding protein 3)
MNTRVSARRIRPQRRLAALCGVLLLMFGIVTWRLVSLQALGDERYTDFSEAQRVRSVELAADRGSIFDRNGNDLSVSIPQRTVWADPSLVPDPLATAAALAPVLGLPREDLEEKLQRDSSFVYLTRRAPDAVADEVEGLALEGIYLLDEPSRIFPSGELARGVLGTVDVDNVGLTGLEAQYNDVLTGEAGELILERDPTGRTIAAAQRRVEPARRGHDLELTIDRAFQFETERLLAQRVRETGAKGGTVVVARPETGEILAMANMATDPETGEVFSTGSNGALINVFEPGSVNKMITLAGAIEDGLVTPETEIMVPDELTIYDYTFTEHDPHPTQPYSVTDILVDSSNIGTIKIGQMLEQERIDHYLREFGFGERTALDFPSESRGLLLPLDDWSGTSIGSIPIGQGVAVTAMQMLFAFNTIANDGVYTPPRIVLAEVDEHGERHEVDVPEPRRVVSEVTADQMRTRLGLVVSEGTGGNAAVDGYPVAGKTGTARKPQLGGGYEDAAGNFQYVATFVGFAPVEHPEVSIIVTLDEPSSTIFGGSASAPVFSDLARYALRQMQIPPVAPEVDQDSDSPPDKVRAEPAGRIEEPETGADEADDTDDTDPDAAPEPGGSPSTTITGDDVVRGPD